MPDPPRTTHTLTRPRAKISIGWLAQHATWLLALYWPALAIGTHWPNLQLPSLPAHPLDAVLQKDKIAHGIGFGGLMLLVLLSKLSGHQRTWAMRCLIALGVCLTYATVDELSQTWIAGRVVSMADLVTNALAILTVYCCAALPSQQTPRRKPVVLITFLGLLCLAISPLMFSGSVWRWLYRGYLDYIGPGYVPLVKPDDLFHFSVGFALPLAITSVWTWRSSNPRRAMAWAAGVAILTGPAIEILQFFTGRTVQASDIFAHSLGTLAALTLIAVHIAVRSTAGRSHRDAATNTNPSPNPAQGSSPAFVGHALLVSLLTLLSRFAGLGRDAVLAAVMGLSVAADAFFIGFLVPNLFRRLFGEGALTAAFIPNYTELLERDPTLAKRFATLTLTLLSVLLVGITLLGELALWWIASTIDDTHKASLAIHYTRLMLPYMPLICVVALIGGVLQVHKHFGPPAAAPLVLNGMIVLAVLLTTGLSDAHTTPATIATWVALSVVLAGVLQLGWQAFVLLQVTGLARSFKGCWPTMRAMLLMMGPMTLGLAVFQINALLDALIAFFFAPDAVGKGISEQINLFGQTFDAPLRNGDVAALNWSQRLYQFPLGVFGIAIATAIFPALSAAAAKFIDQDNSQDHAEPQAAFANIVRQGLRLTVFIALPASAGLILVRIPLARTVFEHGSFTTSDALRVSAILAGYAANVWAYSMTHTLTRTFYALKDATTPLKVSMCMVLVNLTLNLSLIWSLGAAGLAWSTAISAAGQVLLLVVLLQKRVTQPINRSVLTSWGRTCIATVFMAGALLAITLPIDSQNLTWAQSACLLVGLVLLGITVFFVAARLMRADELHWLRKRRVG